MKLQVGIPSVEAARQQLEEITDPEVKRTIEQLCNTVDALVRNLNAMIDTETDLDERVLSVQDMLNNDVLKEYQVGLDKQEVGPFRRRN